MTDNALPPGWPFMIINREFVPPTIALGVLLEVAARHNTEVAESFAERFFDHADYSWNISDVADAIGVTLQALHDEWKKECDARFGDKKGMH